MKKISLRNVAKKRSLRYAGIALALLVSFYLGSRTGDSGARGSGVQVAEAHDHKKENGLWTCSMHPQIKLPKPGKCPICFMDLIPLETGSSAGADVDHPRRLVLSESAARLAGIATAPATRRGISADVKLVGKVAVDETRKEVISARIPGRIDRLYVNSTGMAVRKGDHLASIYSPELVSLQQELIGASGAVASLSAEVSQLVRTNAEQTLVAARDKLRLLGFTEEEMRNVLSRNRPGDHMVIRASQSGIVLDRMATEGTYVETGMPLFHLADLGQVWVLLDAYESDLAWLRLGQKVAFTVEAWPGENFGGKVAFVDPVVDPMTRTVKVRVVAPNKDGRLKPEMFVRAEIKAQVSKSGGVSGASLRGKWVSPMHPEIVKDGPGTCDICGMPLVPAESLGYVTSGFEQVEPLIVPATAPLFTGERAVLYVEVAHDSTGGTYEGREVVLGPRVGEHYVVKSGLSEGERVVVNGAFRIDSELQIRAKPSMMSPDGGRAVDGHAQHGAPSVSSGGKKQPTPQEPAPDIAAMPVSDAFTAGLARLYDSYFGLSGALVKDDLESAKKALEAVEKTRSGLTPGQGKAYAAWTRASKVLAEHLAHRAHAAALSDVRTLFEKISSEIVSLERHYGHGDGTRYLAFCPMAFDNKGAYWLQKEEQISNPYFGPSMLRCGEIKERYAGK